MIRNSLLLHPLFIICLLTLLLNDFYLKQTFSNQFTGKLSDFAGLVVFPMFLAGVYPRVAPWSAIVSGFLFIIWKTPLVSPLIDLFNYNSLFHVQRVSDYSDYWALLVLPPVHWLIKKNICRRFDNRPLMRLAKTSLSVVTILAICATSIQHPPEMPQGTVYIGTTYTIKKSMEETIAMIRSLGYNVDYYEYPSDSTDTKTHRAPYYQTDNIILYNKDSIPLDTILNVKYRLYESGKKSTNIHIINVTLSEQGNIQKWRTLKRLNKQYRKLLKHQLIEKIK